MGVFPAVGGYFGPNCAASPRTGATCVLAIDGRSGAGKSTLAQALALALDAPIVALEDLYGGWDGLEGGVSLLLEAVLKPFASGSVADFASCSQ